ncbi:MAG: hypothetical protein CM15mP74_26780 [Halieaceae bacterium]|nr:MAG: hypothetical protein CM15mP74_26780 [Halieaceae bacterium]
MGQGDVVYVWTQAWNTDEQRACHLRRIKGTRMMFNESGQVQAIASFRRIASFSSRWVIPSAVNIPRSSKAACAAFFGT